MHAFPQHFVIICLHCPVFSKFHVCSFSPSHVDQKKCTLACYRPQINMSIFSSNPFTAYLCTVRSLLLDGKLEIWQIYLYITSSAIQYTGGNKRSVCYRLCPLRIFVSVFLSLCLAKRLRKGPFFLHVIYSLAWPPLQVYNGTIFVVYLVASYCLA